MEELKAAAPQRAGVLLINLGTPAAPNARAIRRYLREFLADPRVVELPRALWWPILYAFILPLRPRRLAHAYAKIWTADGSPLLAHTRRLAQALRAKLAQELGHEVPVALAMTYGEPSIAAALAELDAQRVTRLLVLPLFPQYSATTTAAALDALFAALAKRRRVPELRTVGDYHDEPAYIAALADAVRAHWRACGRGEYLLMSFHGLPERYAQAGDPYPRRCARTAALLAQALDLNENEYGLAYQSRFGRAPWLQPYTDVRIAELARAGVKRLDAICPGFAADCLETLEEVALRYAARFRENGGAALRYIPALNGSSAHAALLVQLVRRHLCAGLPDGARTENPAAQHGGV